MDNDLIEAIQYFQAGDDAPLSSAASILSGRSFGARKITLRVNITVDYDGPSLSDTSSLASLEDFAGRNRSQQSFSFGSPSVDLDDDSVTVSSRDPGTSSSRIGRTLGEPPRSSIAKQTSFTNSDNRNTSTGKSSRTQSDKELPIEDRSRHRPSNFSLIEHSELSAAAERFPADPSAVFENLKLAETLQDDSSSVDFDSLAASERGAAWLRDQNDRAIRSKLGALPEPSDSDELSLSLNSQDDSLGGDLALERDPRGKYYYTYTSGSLSQFQESGYDEGQNGNTEGDVYVNNVMRGPRPTSMQLNWLAAQRIESAENRRINSDLRSLSIEEEIPNQAHPMDEDLLRFLPVSGPSADILTDCSNCGLLLDAIRYVCSTCGEKVPVKEIASASEKGKESDSPTSAFTYPPTSHIYPPASHQLFSSPNSSSSQTYIAGSDSQRYKPLPSIPSVPSLPSLHSLFGGSRTQVNAPSSPLAPTSSGYELCSACLESVGINHAIEAGLSSPGSSPILSSSISPAYDDPQRASQWRRAAPKKGQLRHAYREKVWGHLGWEDVGMSHLFKLKNPFDYGCQNLTVLDEAQISQCSTCNALTGRKRYKCASCSKMHLCRLCYRFVSVSICYDSCCNEFLLSVMFMNYIPHMRSLLSPISLWTHLMALNAIQMHHLISMKNSVSILISRSMETFSKYFSSETPRSQMCTVSRPWVIIPFSFSQFPKAAFLTLWERGFTARYVIWWIFVPTANLQVCLETLIPPMEDTIHHIF